MKGFGIVLSIAGILGLLVALSIDPSVASPMGARMINYHKASERQNYIIISSAIFLGGLVLFGLGALSQSRAPAQAKAQDEDESLASAADLMAMCDAVVSGNVNAASELLNKGADPNGRYKGIGWLHMACLNDHAAIVALLIQRGADVNVKDRYGSRPVDHAEGNDDILALLRQHRAKAMLAAQATP
jgi:hypothetical protein